MKEKLIGKKVIIRGNRSGVEYGTLKEWDGGSVVELTDARRLWFWKGAASLSQLAKEGVKNPENCKFTVYVESIVILDAIEIIPCTEEAVTNIESVAEWKIRN